MTEANAGDSGSSPGSRRPPGEMAPHCSVPDCEIPRTEGTSGLTVRRVTISPTVTGATEQEQHCSITAVPLRTHRLPTGSARAFPPAAHAPSHRQRTPRPAAGALPRRASEPSAFRFPRPGRSQPTASTQIRVRESKGPRALAKHLPPVGAPSPPR